MIESFENIDLDSVNYYVDIGISRGTFYHLMQHDNFVRNCNRDSLFSRLRDYASECVFDALVYPVCDELHG